MHQLNMDLSFYPLTSERWSDFEQLFGAKVIPARGAWIEIETEATGVISVRIDRKRKFADSRRPAGRPDRAQRLWQVIAVCDAARRVGT